MKKHGWKQQKEASLQHMFIWLCPAMGSSTPCCRSVFQCKLLPWRWPWLVVCRRAVGFWSWLLLARSYFTITGVFHGSHSAENHSPRSRVRVIESIKACFPLQEGSLLNKPLFFLYSTDFPVSFLQYNKHLFVHIGHANHSYSDPLLESVDIRQIYDKFPEKKGGLKELFGKGPQNAFFLVKFWVSKTWHWEPFLAAWPVFSA